MPQGKRPKRQYKRSSATFTQEHFDQLDVAWKAWKEDGDLKARDFIIDSYRPLVESYAQRAHQRKPWIFSKEDLVQAGNVGLIQAVDRFEPDRGNKFGTYAPTRIQGAILDEVNSMDWTPRSIRRAIRKTLLAIEYLQSHGNPDPTIEEISQAAKIAEKDVIVGLSQQNKTHISPMDKETVSVLEESSNGGFGIPSSAEEQNPDLTKIDQKQALFDALLQYCTKAEIEALYHFYWQDQNLMQTGESMGINSYKAGHLRKSALEKLKRKLNRQDWDDPFS